MTEKKQISRKDFLKGMGTSLAGVAVAGSLGGLLTGCSAETASSSSEAAPYPFKYKKLDPAIAEERAYNAYFDQGGWGVGATCIGMVTDVDTSKKLVGELFNWYKTHEFPQYQPEDLNLTTTIAETTLCEDSVGNFMEAQGVAYGDHERKARCAGVTADVVRKIVELLNETV